MDNPSRKISVASEKKAFPSLMIKSSAGLVVTQVPGPILCTLYVEPIIRQEGFAQRGSCTSPEGIHSLLLTLHRCELVSGTNSVVWGWKTTIQLHEHAQDGEGKRISKHLVSATASTINAGI